MAKKIREWRIICKSFLATSQARKLLAKRFNQKRADDEMKKILLLSMLYLVMVAVGSQYIINKKLYMEKYIIVDKYHIVYYPNIGEVEAPIKHLIYLQINPAVKEISWREPTKKSRQYRQYKWTSEEGFILDGVLSAEI